MPDAEEVDGVPVGFEGNTDLYTRQVTIQPLVIESENKKQYESGKIVDWYRKNNEEVGQIELDDFAKMPSSQKATVHNSEREGIAYEIRCRANEWLIYQLRVRDAQGQVKEERLISSYGYGTSTIYTTALVPESCRVPVGGTLEIRVSAVMEPGGLPGAFVGGISQWDKTGENWTIISYDDLP